jgi:diadenosine tetraphosphate (Ap4A) HIT family hydrolase
MSFELHTDLRRDGIEIGNFPLCLLLLINDANYPWFVLVPRRTGLRDLIDLQPADYQMFWAESAHLSRAIMKLFQGEKLNVAALGNVTPQLHIHHIVRRSSDPAWPAPIWGKHPLRPYDPAEIRNIRIKMKSAKVPGLELVELRCS